MFLLRMWDVRSMCGGAGQGVVSQGLGSAPALSIPLNTLSSLTSLQLSSSGIQRVRRQRGVLQKQGSTGKSLGTPYPPGPGSALSEPLPSCAVAAVSRVQEPCVTPKAQNSPGETNICQRSLMPWLLHQSLHQQTSQPCLPLVFAFWEAGLSRALCSLCADASPSPTVLL